MNLRPTPKEPVEINLIPLIDVLIVVLIFVMVSSNFERESQISIQLPEASQTAQTETPPEMLEVTVDAEGRFFVNQQEVISTDAGAVGRAMARVVGERRDLPVLISADGRTPHQSVIKVLDAAGQLGLSKLTFATVQPSEQR